MIRVACLLVLLGSALGCGSPQPAPTVASKPVAKGPRCAADADDMPKDARGKMASMQGDVRKCYQMGTGAADADVQVEVSVAESGEVRDVRVLGTAPHPSAVECLKKTLRSAKFAKFCGADIAISWTYALR